ncbi:KilA-N domain-containing protein [Massilia sp. SYSU DXS3249]
MSSQQLNLELIHHQADGTIIDQRTGDGYINATALCKASGKQWSEYRRNMSTVAFLAELEADMGMPTSSLIHSIVGGDSRLQGTWVHPQVAVNLAGWLSPKFAVQVSKWVADWMSRRGSPQTAVLPVHLQRYMANDNKVPPGHFSILQETGIGLFGPLHQLGFDIPKGWVPDISVGKLFCAWLRKTHGVNTDSFPTYAHDYLDGRPIVYPNAYPDDYLAMYRTWFRTVWLPENGRRYFKSKDPSSIAYLDRMPALAAPVMAPKLPK